MQIPLYFIGFFVLIYLIVYGFLVKIILGLKLKKGDYRLVGSDEIPVHIKKLLRPHMIKLKEMGFAYSHCQLGDEPVVSSQSKKLELICIHQPTKTYANIYESPMPDKNIPVRIELLTMFSDGTKLLTVNGIAHEIPGNIPDVVLIDPYAETFEKQLQAHLEKLENLKLNKTPVMLKPADYVASDKKVMDNYIENLNMSGYIRSVSENSYKICILPALKLALKMLKGKPKYKNMLGKKKKLQKNDTDESLDIPVEVEVKAFKRLREIQSPKSGSMGKWVGFIISMLLFMIAFKVVFSLSFVFIILAVILVHELGHMMGMIIFKYKDVKIMFLPFLGAATMASETKATAFQKVIVFLLGPFPGIVLGTLCLCMNTVFETGWLFELGLFFLILNYINLLPIMPLDGGRVFDLILFSRASFLRNGFLILSIIILGIVGIASRDPILLFIPFFLIVSLPLQIMQNRGVGKLTKMLRNNELDMNDEAILPGNIYDA